MNWRAYFGAIALTYITAAYLTDSPLYTFISSCLMAWLIHPFYFEAKT